MVHLEITKLNGEWNALKTTILSLRHHPRILLTFWRTVYITDGFAVAVQCKKKQLSFNRLLTLSDNVTCVLSNYLPKEITAQFLLNHHQKLTAAQCNNIKQQIASCLRLTGRLSEFYQEVKRYPKYRWVAKMKGRTDASAPSVFEEYRENDLHHKLHLGAQHTIMVENLIGEWESHLMTRTRFFPLPETLAGMSEQFLRKP